MNFYKNKVVLVTGASSGIGKALAVALLAQGAKVAICGRNLQALMEMERELSTLNLFIMQADVSIENECKQFVEHSAQHFGQIDLLINNAGISMRALFAELDLKVLRQTMDINFWGTVYCTKYSLPFIVHQKGSIASIASIAGFKGLPCRSGYSASKFAMQGFMESLRIELLHSGVNVLWISPGFVASNIRNVALGATGKSQKETPLEESKLMSAEECAQKILDAIQHRKRTLVMTLQGKLTVWLNKFFPSIVDKLVYNHFANEPDSPLKK